MGKNKQRKQIPFNPPVRHPQNMVAMAKQLEKEIDTARLESSNQTLNLCASAFIIVLKEFYDFDNEKLQDTMNKVFEQLELCGKELVTLDQMMDLCEEYGIEVKKDAEKMESIGKQMQNKLKVYQLLDRGITEVEDIARESKLSTREASAYRWQYNKIKYGKDYEGDAEMATKKEDAMRLYKKGYTVNQVMDELQITKGSAFNYQTEYKKTLGMVASNEKPKTADELADALFGNEEEPSIEKKHYEVPKGDEDSEKPIQAIEEQPKPSKVKRKLQELSRTVTYKGEFGEYEVSNKVVVVRFEDSEMSLDKNTISGLIEELTELSLTM
ncbi:hypothetical protein CS063_01405 [Sporanaerobium hydrogeniformans]|uniref:Uncharacterized protein n=1 Tax=Sporanaerobium hydrogeniformans TaxID=3072179 RepID=A0AC61DG12_9FIRM|nr:hypothetical protein [Sporanaerobium hydrogeniformans]PHV72159.1 hypothetical protein CS063_01405 [Sporanaerobium hydrogeniformans]